MVLGIGTVEMGAEGMGREGLIKVEIQALIMYGLGFCIRRGNWRSRGLFLSTMVLCYISLGSKYRWGLVSFISFHSFQSVYDIPNLSVFRCRVFSFQPRRACALTLLLYICVSCVSIELAERGFGNKFTK